MKVYVFFVGLLLFLSSCGEASKPVELVSPPVGNSLIDKVRNSPLMENGNYVILTWGFPNFEWRIAADSISGKWKIVYKEITGCMATYEEADSIAEHNKQVEQLIEKEYGKGWEEKYEREIDAIVKSRNVYKIK